MKSLSVNLERRLGVAEEHIVAQRAAILRGEKIHVLLREVEVVVVETLQVVLEEKRRDLFVELLATEMPLFEQPPDGDFDLRGIGLVARFAGGRERGEQGERETEETEIFHGEVWGIGNSRGLKNELRKIANWFIAP